MDSDYRRWSNSLANEEKFVKIISQKFQTKESSMEKTLCSFSQSVKWRRKQMGAAVGNDHENWKNKGKDCFENLKCWLYEMLSMKWHDVNCLTC